MKVIRINWLKIMDHSLFQKSIFQIEKYSCFFINFIFYLRSYCAIERFNVVIQNTVQKGNSVGQNYKKCC